MAIAGADLAQVFARHAIQTVDGFGVIAGRRQQFVERRPVVSPVEIEADALAQFALVNLAPPPFFENVLVAGEDGFHAQHDRPVAGQRALLDQRRGVTLGRGQGMVVADQEPCRRRADTV